MKASISKSSVSVFFPCYNDSKSISKLVLDAKDVLQKYTDDFEIIVIDDGSKDKSLEVLKKLLKKVRQLKLIVHEKNRGYGGALKSGFKHSSKDLIFYTDGDGQYDVKELPILLNLMTDDINFVNGIKMDRQDYRYRIILGSLYSFITRWAFLLPTYDVDCDFRLIRRKIIKKINLTSNSGSICVELVKKAQKANAKFRQVSIHHYERRYGKSQFFRLNYLFRTFSELSLLWIKLMLLDILKAKLKK